MYLNWTVCLPFIKQIIINVNPFPIQVVDKTVMAQSNVRCSCLSGSVLSASATSHSFQLSYESFTNDQSSSSQGTLSVSYQNGLCGDTDSIMYDGELLQNVSGSYSDGLTVSTCTAGQNFLMANANTVQMAHSPKYNILASFTI